MTKKKTTMDEQIEKLPLTSLDIKEEQIQKLKELFPEAFTEGNKIDWEKLKLTLGENIEVGKERFGMNWAGKADCFKTIQQPSIATLVPDREGSVDFDNTENLFIEGDNLEVLKLLQKSYLAKIKMIYIDPPYNTGKDFIYPDNYAENLSTYLEYTGQVDGEGKKFSTNTETDGRFHSKWMNMMYPRLFLAKNLLKEDGVIFISIDDKEVHNLKEMCSEIFGEENFIGTIVWKNATDNNPTNVAVEHEYVHVYAKTKEALEAEWKSKVSDVKEKLVLVGSQLATKHEGNLQALQLDYASWFRDNKPFMWPLDRYKYIDFDGIYTGSQSVHNPGKEGYRYDVIHPVTGKPCKEPLMGYRFPKETMDELLRNEKILFGDDENKIIELKVYAKDYQDKLPSVLEIDGRLGAYDVKALFPELKKAFTNPKPVKLISAFLPFLVNGDDIVLDFFAGSCTTAHAVYELNSSDNGKRKFIMVQLPEPCDADSEVYKAGYLTIADISKERIRRAGNIYSEKDKEKLDFEPSKKNDLGFKVFKLEASNFKIWDAGIEKKQENVQSSLDFHVEHVNPDAKQESILYEILLKAGFELSTPIKELKIEGKSVFSIADGELLICLEKKLTHELIKRIAENSPSRVICLDEGFQNNDQLKTNAVQIMKSKNVLNFRTV